jgi:predicted  nucleic acid-binding Zn-ribbon protein
LPRVQQGSLSRLRDPSEEVSALRVCMACGEPFPAASKNASLGLCRCGSGLSRDVASPDAMIASESRVTFAEQRRIYDAERNGEAARISLAERSERRERDANQLRLV